MSKQALAIMLGITGDFSFAAGCLLLALRRHSPTLSADILLYTDGTLAPADEALLRGLGAMPRAFTPPEGEFSPASIKKFSLLSLARFEAFSLLKQYRTVIWLDVDIAIQGDISALAGYGPLAMALEDPHFSDTGATNRASVNARCPVPGLNPDAPNFNSGVLVLQDTLPDPDRLHRLCLNWLRMHGGNLHYIDQGVLNMLAQSLRDRDPSLVAELPYDRFNAHPRNPEAQHAAIAHAFGAYKLWDDGLTLCSFPEWARDYRHWTEMGGRPWQGEMSNASFGEGGAFFMLRRCYHLITSAQDALDAQRARLEADLEKERALRQKLEQALQRAPACKEESPVVSLEESYTGAFAESTRHGGAGGGLSG